MTAEPVRAQIRIDAPPERVWEFFTLPEAIIRWMGEFAVLAPRPGGEFTVNVKGAPVRGRYLELDPPHRLLLSWGYAGSAELPPGASTIEVRLVPDGTGTRVHLEHRDLPEPEKPGHAEGWKHYLARLATAGTGDPGPDPGMRPVSSPQGGGRSADGGGWRPCHQITRKQLRSPECLRRCLWSSCRAA